MNEKLQKYGLVAEIVSGISVIITLIILIFNIRENSEIVRVSLYSDVIDSINDIDHLALTDPELRRIYSSFVNQNFDQITEDDFISLRLILVTRFRDYEKAFFMERYGILGNEEWSRFKINICQNNEMASELGVIDFQTISALTAEFRNYIKTSC